MPRMRGGGDGDPGATVNGGVVRTDDESSLSSLLQMDTQSIDNSGANAEGQQTQSNRGTISVSPKPNNPTTDQITIQSGAPVDANLATSSQLTPGKASISVVLVADSNGKTVGQGTMAINVVGDVKNVQSTLLTPKGPVATGTSTVLGVRVMPIQRNSDFGTSGPASLKFTIVDAGGHSYSGTTRVNVAGKLPGDAGGNGHIAETIRPTGRTNFTVP